MFGPHMDPTSGCGNGRQSFALAEHSPSVIGVEVSAEAIRGAHALYRFDMLTDDEVAALHADLGDANIYSAECSTGFILEILRRATPARADIGLRAPPVRVSR